MAHLDLMTNIVAESAQPVTGTNKDYDGLLSMIGEAHFSLLGEATHGRHTRQGFSNSYANTRNSTN